MSQNLKIGIFHKMKISFSTRNLEIIDELYPYQYELILLNSNNMMIKRFQHHQQWKGGDMIRNYKLKITIFLIISLCLFIIGCASGNDVSPDPMEPEETVEPEPEAEDESEPEEAEIEAETKINVVVNVDVLHLRSGPSADHEILARLHPGNVLEVIDEQDGWLKVNREQGWVHGDSVVKPENPDKLYEVLPVEVQPVGYSEEQVAIFIEDSTSFSLYGFILPEFDHPNEISNEDLISAVTLNGVTPHYNDSRHSFIMTGKDVQETARSIFGSDLNDIEHKDVWPYDWNDEDQVYQILAFGPSSYTDTKVLDVRETSEEFIVDAVHLRYYYNPQETEHISYVIGELTRMSEFDSYEDLLENSDAVVLVDEHHDDGTIDKHIDLFPVRRYILSKEGDGTCYIRQSYLLDD